MALRRFMLLLTFCLCAVASHADEIPPDHHFVEVWLDPAKAAVGEHITLNVMIGVNSYFAAATEIALPNIEHALVLHEQPALNGSRTVGEQYFTTQTHLIDIYPGREGILVVPGLRVNYTPSVEVNGELTNKPVQVVTDQLLALVQVPPAMAGLSGFMVSEDVQISDAWSGATDTEFQVGDVLTRVVTITATDMAAMNMPQFNPIAPPGVSVTMAEPGLSSSSGREAAAATMVQHMSYAIESPGQYQLGGEVLSWWDPEKAERQDHQFELMTVDAGGLPWRLFMLLALAALIILLLALALRRYLRRRDPQDLAIRQQLHSKDAGSRLAALYAYADYHQSDDSEPVRLRSLLSSSRDLVDNVLRARFSSEVVDGEPSRGESKTLYRQIRKNCSR